MPIARPAFTLVELLVVIGLIALLIGILLPALNVARESAKGVQCLSNLRQMTIAANAYATKHRGSFPIAYYAGDEGTTYYSYQWDLTTVYAAGQPARVVPGILWEERGPMAVQQCPSYEGPSNTEADPYTGYNYNVSYVGHGESEAVVAPAKAASIRRPAEVALFGDGQYGGGANKFMRAPFPNPGDATFTGRWSGTQGFRHRGRTNVAFCDGHAEPLAERYTANADGMANVARGTGFLSRDNRRYGGS